MSKIKYIVGLDLSDINKRQCVAVIFAEHVNHSAVGDNLFGGTMHALSAGFVGLDVSKEDGQLAPWVGGESESMGLKSIPEFDLKYVRLALGLGSGYPVLKDEERMADYSWAVEQIRKREAAERAKGDEGKFRRRNRG